MAKRRIRRIRYVPHARRARRRRNPSATSLLLVAGGALLGYIFWQKLHAAKSLVKALPAKTGSSPGEITMPAMDLRDQARYSWGVNKDGSPNKNLCYIQQPGSTMMSTTDTMYCHVALGSLSGGPRGFGSLG